MRMTKDEELEEKEDEDAKGKCKLILQQKLSSTAAKIFFTFMCIGNYWHLLAIMTFKFTHVVTRCTWHFCLGKL